jgi:hypothetical protein
MKLNSIAMRNSCESGYRWKLLNWGQWMSDVVAEKCVSQSNGEMVANDCGVAREAPVEASGEIATSRLP